MVEKTPANKLSAMLDGEIQDKSIIDEALKCPKLRKRWYGYHLTNAAIKGDLIKVDVTSKVRQAIASIDLKDEAKVNNKSISRYPGRRVDRVSLGIVLGSILCILVYAITKILPLNSTNGKSNYAYEISKEKSNNR